MDDLQTGKRPNLIIRIWDWMDRRFQVGKLMQTLLHVYVPKDAKTYYLGGTTLFLFFIQGVTGTLLALYYKPTPETAYDSVLFITSSVNFGWLIRSIHHWGANLMIIFCALHLLRIFLQGAYKPPREMTWIIGVVLLLLTLLFGFTGYLLPWDERAYWATTVGSEFAGAVPLIGDFLLQFLRGGEAVSEATLSRFYGAHTLFLPEILAVFLLIHIVLMHQQGLANPKKPAKIPSSPQPDGEKEKNHTHHSAGPDRHAGPGPQAAGAELRRGHARLPGGRRAQRGRALPALSRSRLRTGLPGRDRHSRLHREDLREGLPRRLRSHR